MKQFITKLYIYKFFDDFIIIYPLYAVMFADKGLSASQISILFLAWSVTSFILEIPSGVLADRFDRRSVLIIGQFVRVIGYALWLFIPNFVGFFIGFMFWGMKSALTSGTFEAYVYDAIKSYNVENSYKKVYGRLKSISFVAILLASITASPLVTFGYEALLVLSITSLIISNGALLFSSSFKIHESTHEKAYFKILKRGISLVLKKKSLLIMVLFSSCIVGFMALDEYLPLYSKEAGLDVRLVGTLLAIYSLVQAITSSLSHKINVKNNSLLGLFMAIGGGILIITGVFTNLIGLIAMMVIGGVSTFLMISSEETIQNLSRSDVRATVSSVKGFITEITAFSVYILFGIISSTSDVSRSILVLGVIWVVLGGAFCVAFLRKQNKVGN